MQSSFWLGPYNVRVPMSVFSVTAMDGGNTLCQDGTETEMYCGPQLTRDVYLSRFAELKEDGHYWYKPRPEDRSFREMTEDEAMTMVIRIPQNPI